MNIAEKINDIPDNDMITLVHNNGQAESSFKAKDLKKLLTADPFKDYGKGWMRSDERVNTLP
jgi:hypothetical protein